MILTRSRVEQTIKNAGDDGISVRGLTKMLTEHTTIIKQHLASLVAEEIITTVGKYYVILPVPPKPAKTPTQATHRRIVF